MNRREADEDSLYSLFFGYTDLQPTLLRIKLRIEQLNLGARYNKIVEKTLQTSHRAPKLGLILFAMWLLPDLKLEEGSQPSRSEPFLAGLHAACMNILEGRMLSLQQFVRTTITDYLVNPRR